MHCCTNKALSLDKTGFEFWHGVAQVIQVTPLTVCSARLSFREARSSVGELDGRYLKRGWHFKVYSTMIFFPHIFRKILKRFKEKNCLMKEDQHLAVFY